MNASTNLDFMTYHVTGLPKDASRMVAYICEISDHPLMLMKTLVDEKEAVKDEMLAFGAETVSSLIGAFNHTFYKNGMQFKDDWELQIENLTHLTLDDLKRTFKEEFNTGSVTFLVSGKFDRSAVLAEFSKALRDRPQVKFKPLDCFTYAHTIVFDKVNTPTNTLMIGFPSRNKDFIYASAVCDVLKNILFEELRTKKKLIYNFHLEHEVMPCGTQCIFEISVQPDRVAEVVRILFQTLKKYTVEPFHKKHIYAMKTLLQRELKSTLPNLEMLSHQVAINPRSKVILREDVFKRVWEATSLDLQKMVKELFVPEHATLAYQGSKDLNLQWPAMRSQTRRVFKK